MLRACRGGACHGAATTQINKLLFCDWFFPLNPVRSYLILPFVLSFGSLMSLLTAVWKIMASTLVAGGWGGKWSRLFIMRMERVLNRGLRRGMIFIQLHSKQSPINPPNHFTSPTSLLQWDSLSYWGRFIPFWWKAFKNVHAFSH